MKIALCSDLHLEFEDIDLKNTEGAEVLVLSGDIMIAEDLHAQINNKYPNREIWIEVSEDGENGSFIKYL